MQLSRKGFRVGLVSRSVADLEQLAAELNALRENSATPLPCDIGNRDEVEQAIDDFMDQERRMDVAVLCAGALGEMARIDRSDPARWHETLRTNLDGSYLAARSFIRAVCAGGPFPAAGAPGDNSPRILFVSSGAGRKPRTPWGAYAVSKAAVEALATLTAAEASETGVLAASVNPGGTATRMRAEAYPEEDPATLPDPDQIAAAFMRILLLPDEEYNGRAFEAREWLEDTPVHP